MLRLYAYALDPVAESTADNRSFLSRKGRSMHDALAYLTLSLTGDDAPGFIFRCDIHKFFSNIPYLGDVRGVDVAIRRLRTKIEDDPNNPQFIMTRRGVGYYFEIK